MPTERRKKTVVTVVDVCDTCGNYCIGLGHNQCDACGKLACLNCACSEMEDLFRNDRSWLCHVCHKLGIAYKQSIRKWKERIKEDRADWRKLCRDHAKDGFGKRFLEEQ